MKLNRIILAVGLFLTTVMPAHAGPLAALIPVIVGVIAKSVVLQLVLTIALSAAVSALQNALRPKPRPPGIQTERRLTGGTVSRRIIVGEYCTAGSEVTPPMSHGYVDKTPNAYLTFVIAVADLPVTALSGLILNGEFVSITANGNQYGDDIGGKYSGYAWIKFYTGDQIAADPMLASKYGSYVRPWDSSMIGTGVAYAILTFRFKQEIFKGEPECKFVVQGSKFYDPRLDTTVGGSGSHRYDDPSTWEYTANNVVIIYNILRGIAMPDGTRWGGECSAEDLPLANWVAGMNVCDETVLISSGSEPRYKMGYEISLSDDEPAEIIEEALKGCSASMTEVGGVYKIRVGPPSLPVMFVTDDDFLVNRGKDYTPFPSVNASRNTLYATYPNPDEGWATHDAPRLTNADYVAQDDGQELSASIGLPTVTSPTQVQRLMLAWLKDDRRWRNHSLSIGHYGFVLEPLDTISWTSAKNGYSSKLFEISATSESLLTLVNMLALREVDASDFDWSTDDELPDPAIPPVWELPASQAVPGFAVSAWAVPDGDGNNRRPAIRCVWTADAAEDATALKIQVRAAGTDALVTDWTVTNVTDGEAIITSGIVATTAYEVRAMYIVNRTTEWSAWIGVSTGTILLDERDLNIDSYIFDGLDFSPGGLLEYQGNVVGQLTLTGIGAADANFLADISRQLDDGEIETLKTLVVADRVRVDGNEAIAAARFDLSASINYGLSAEATARTELAVLVNDNHAQVTTQLTALTNADVTLAASITSLTATVDSNTAAITSEASARATADSALAADITALEATVDSNTAAITSEASARASADAAIAADLTTLEATVDDNTANITTQAAAIASLDGSVASLNTTVSTQGAAITANATAISNVEDDVETAFARVALTLNVDDHITGWELNNNGEVGNMKILADNFEIVKPGSGERTVYANGAWKIYDSSGTLRVQLGNLSA